MGAAANGLIEEKALSKGHTLSFGDQPYFAELMRQVRDSGQIVLIVGAGASIDSGLSPWPQLLNAMADQIKDPDIKRVARADTSDQLRKAENIQTLVLQTTGESAKGILRTALLPDHLDPKPGDLSWSIARLVATNPGRFQILTTNFDSMLEVALAEQLDVPVVGVSLGDYLADPDHDNSSECRVIHLHGRVSKNDKPPALQPLVLTESEFLRHGPDVQRALRSAMRSAGAVVFVGVSLTDPNLVGSLWGIANGIAAGGTDPTAHGADGRATTELERERKIPKYVFSVVDAPGLDDCSFFIAARIARFKSMYLNEKLLAKPILLKSYSQLIQAFNEMGLCAAAPSNYVLRPKTGRSTRYGVRFTQALNDAYRAIGVTRGADLPNDGRDLSDKLNDVLAGRRGIIAEIERLLREEAGSAMPAGEHFGLFLWLRARAHDGLKAQYAVHRVGCSMYSHRLSWSFKRTDEVSFNSQYLAARCLFMGGIQLKNIDPPRMTSPEWRGIMARPLILHGYTSSVSPSAKSEDMYDRLTLGSVTLNSTFNAVDEKGVDGPMSALSTLDECGAIGQLGEFVNSAVLSRVLFPS